MRRALRSPFYLSMKPETFLFDLDGTLADSAIDLAAAANHLREVRNLKPVDYDVLRKTASSGARGLLGAAFGITPEQNGYQALEKEFLDYYSEHLADNTRLFPGVRELIDFIEKNDKPWGIVTNKHARFTVPVLNALKLNPKVLVCGDTLEKRKPDPDQIIYALQKLQVGPKDAVYVGDDIRDIIAARAVGVFAIAASWGYLGSAEPIEDWHADLILNNPELLATFQLP